MSKKKLIISVSILIVVALAVSFWFWQKNTQKPVEKEEVSQELKTDKIDMSDWETYRNEELGIEFKYPKDWEIRKSETNYGVNKTEEIYFYATTTFNNPSAGNRITKIVIEVFDNIYGKTPSEVIITKTGLSADALKDAFLGEVILDKQKVSKYTIPSFTPLPGLIFEYKDKVYKMIYNLDDNYFSKVLETFKFIE